MKLDKQYGGPVDLAASQEAEERRQAKKKGEALRDIVRTQKEIDALFDECVDGQQDRFIGKTYEMGIANALLWLFTDARNPLEIDGYFDDLPSAEEAVQKMKEGSKDNVGG